MPAGFAILILLAALVLLYAFAWMLENWKDGDR